MNILSGVMKLAQLALLLFLVSSVVDGYNDKFQEGAVGRGPGKSGIGLFSRLNHVLIRHSKNLQDEDDGDKDTGDDKDGSEDGHVGNGDEGNGNDGNDVEDNGKKDDDVEENDHEDKGDHSSISNRIVGGTEAAYGEFPWQVSVILLLEAGDEVIEMVHCGAVIINEFWVLSAGHCFLGPSASDFMLRVGNHYVSRKDSAERDYKVERIIIHPQYNAKENVADYDIALLKIVPSANGQGIQFNKYVQPAPLPDTRASFPEGTHCVVSGWGTTSYGGADPDVLLKTDSPIVNQQRCKQVYAGIRTVVTERTICSGNVKGGTGVCGGDSGGGLICEMEVGRVLAGIVSSGVPCAKPDYVTMFSLVPKFLPWIRSTVRE